MEKITSSARFFDVEATLECGQIFRYERADNGFYVHSGDKTCFAYNDGENAVIVTEDGDKDYFYRFFDLDADYGAYYAAAKKEGGILSQAAEAGKGIRILRQNEEETLFSFLVSQNNRIPRIKKILNRLCESSGEKYLFCGKEQRAFPSAKSLAEKELSYFTRAGLGYRDRYVKAAADKIAAGYSLSALRSLDTLSLKKELCSFDGVGEKVADCIALFAFHRFDSFPVDTWIYKIYKEDYGGKETSRSKAADYFLSRFRKNAGIFQQYLFQYKRSGGKN